MKKFLFLCMALVCLFLTSCTSASPDAEQEAVWVLQPWFFGHGGIDKTPVSTGRSYGVLSTNVVYFTITPQRYDETFDDVFSNDNTPLDFSTNVVIQVKKGKSPVLLENYGTNWYKNNIQQFYVNKTRDYISMYSPFDLISNRDIVAHIDTMILTDMRNYVAQLSKKKEFPIDICSVTTGFAKPNKGQLAEMNKTAAAIQGAKTQERTEEMENARAKAEKARANADKAYMLSMNLSPDEFIQLKYIEIQSKYVDMIAEKKDANIDVLIGGGEMPMWNIKK